MRRNETLRLQWTLLLAPIGALLCLSMGMHNGANPAGLREVTKQQAVPSRDEQTFLNGFISNTIQMCDLSLAVRENVDFVLTPALLVQEAVSDGVVLTYPEE
jgi:hypothetical protein